MSALSTREALATGLCDLDDSMYHHDRTDDHPCSMCKGKADALIASGAVVDPATLADEMTAWADEIEPDRQWLNFPVTPDEIRAKRDRWFAAALTERGA